MIRGKNDKFNKELLDAIIRGDKQPPQEPPKTPLDFEESRLQSSCVLWFRTQYRRYANLLFSVPNGAKRSRRQGARYKAEGMVAGVSDLILLIPRGCYGSLCIEMKQKGNYQQKNQKEWQALAESVGNKYVVCKTIEEFMRAVNSYMSL